MGKHLVDLDEHLLEEAQQLLGTSTMKDTVNQGLAEIIRAHRRRQHARRLESMEGLDLDDPQVMDRAWR